jgi:hypothetical protein
MRIGARWTIAVAAWVAVAGLTTVAGLTAVNSLGAGIFGDSREPLSGAEVDRRLAAAAPSASPSADASRATSAGPSATATATPTATATATAAPPVDSATRRVLATAGGTIVASCTGGLVTMHSWSPAQGFRSDHAEPGPATTASIRFKADGNDVRIQVTCVAGEPQLRIVPDDD